MASHSLCQNEMKQMRSSSRYILKTVISLIFVAKEVKGDGKVEILNAKETKDREKRNGTAVHTLTTGKTLVKFNGKFLILNTTFIVRKSS